MSIRLVSILLISLLQISCGVGGFGSKPIAYSPQATNVENPVDELKALILANTASGCVTEPQAMGGMMVVKAVCSYGVGNQVLRYGQVQSIAMDQSGEWYGVRVKHTDHAEDFFWSSKSLKDAQRIADCVAALSKKKPEATPASM